MLHVAHGLYPCCMGHKGVLICPWGDEFDIPALPGSDFRPAHVPIFPSVFLPGRPSLSRFLLLSHPGLDLLGCQNPLLKTSQNPPVSSTPYRFMLGSGMASPSTSHHTLSPLAPLLTGVLLLLLGFQLLCTLTIHCPSPNCTLQNSTPPSLKSLLPSPISTSI